MSDIIDEVRAALKKIREYGGPKPNCIRLGEDVITDPQFIRWCRKNKIKIERAKPVRRKKSDKLL